MELPLCDNCIKMLLRNMSKEEILLLFAMKKNNYINPQMSCDEKSLVPLVKGLSIYKVRKILGRLTLVGMVDTNKLLGSTKYFLTKTGSKAITFYTIEIKDLTNSARLNESKKKGDRK